MRSLDRTMKKITEVLAESCHVPIMEVCVLNHDDNHFKAYVHGTNWYKQHKQHMCKCIMNVWGVNENNIDIHLAPKAWGLFGSTGYVIEVTY